MKHSLIAILALILLGSCTKTNEVATETLQVSFPVYDQMGVDKYVIQTSIDGKAFQDKGSVKANYLLSTTYNIQVQQEINSKGRVYLRVQSVDLNGDAAYSPIQTVIL